MMSSSISADSVSLWQPWLPSKDEAQSFLKCKAMTAGSKRELHHVIYHSEPLDMSITKRIRVSLPSYQQSIQSRQASAGVVINRRPHRPSVITSCIGNNNNNSSSNNNNNDISSTSSNSSSGNTSDLLDDDGVCASVVNEHFRRSLGPNYREYFPSSNNRITHTGSSGNDSDIEDDAGSGLSVDDHFAKALGGDTWLRLQQRNEHRSDESEASASTTSLSSTTSSMNQTQDEQDVVSTSAPDCRSGLNNCCSASETIEEKSAAAQKLLLRHHRVSQ